MHTGACPKMKHLQLVNLKKKTLYQRRPRRAWKGISDFLQFVSSRFTRSIFFHRYISGEETNQNTDIEYSQTEMEIENYCESPPVHASDDTSNDALRSSPPLDLQTPDPYTHQKITPQMTSCVTTTRSWICEP